MTIIHVIVNSNMASLKIVCQNLFDDDGTGAKGMMQQLLDLDARCLEDEGEEGEIWICFRDFVWLCSRGSVVSKRISPSSVHKARESEDDKEAEELEESGLVFEDSGAIGLAVSEIDVKEI
jgi:hypothetical protein